MATRKFTRSPESEKNAKDDLWKEKGERAGFIPSLAPLEPEIDPCHRHLF
jgi:hypothetical protein